MRFSVPGGSGEWQLPHPQLPPAGRSGAQLCHRHRAAVSLPGGPFGDAGVNRGRSRANIDVAGCGCRALPVPLSMPRHLPNPARALPAVQPAAGHCGMLGRCRARLGASHLSGTPSHRPLPSSGTAAAQGPLPRLRVPPKLRDPRSSVSPSPRAPGSPRVPTGSPFQGPPRVRDTPRLRVPPSTPRGRSRGGAGPAGVPTQEPAGWVGAGEEGGGGSGRAPPGREPGPGRGRW